ncbi:efflux RND transporter permease subunit, partial [Gordoniibacillus kamchatkensis]|uniref:efflux RND transporter permease subunit n=1 Tax=Gordoniibacillus kamchatkensis TaxID=1590651 RepID=UPI0012DFEBF9
CRGCGWGCGWWCGECRAANGMTGAAGNTAGVGPAMPGGGAGMPGGTAGAVPGAAGLPTVRLSDIASVSLVTRAESVSRTNGKPSIGIQVTKASEANTVEVVNAVKREAARIEQNVPGAHALVMLDQGKPIEDSVRTMVSKAAFGAIFAVVVIMSFLRNVRTTLISIVSIPLSLLIALLVLQRLGITLNVMTLGAMTVAIGRVVDDSIVVIENNYRRMRLRSEELEGERLIVSATGEMFVPIFSSTLVTIAVFLPLGFVSGPIGQLFMPFALTMVFALLASLLVAVTVVPALTHALFPRGAKKRPHRRERQSGALARSYRRTLEWALRHKLLTAATAVLLLLGSLALSGIVGFSFLPEEEQKYVMITYTPGPGKRLADAEQAALSAEKLLMARKGVMNLQYSVGGQSPMSPAPSRSALFYVQYANSFADFAAEKKALVEALRPIDPSGSWGEMNYGGGVGSNKLSLNVYGDNADDIRAAVGLIQGAIRQEGSFDRIDNSLSQTYSQYTFVVNEPKLASYGLSAGQLALQLSPSRSRPVLTNITENGRDVPVYLETEPPAYATIQDMQAAPLPSPLASGAVLRDVTQLREGVSPNTITRKDGKLYAEVTANVTVKNVGKATAALQQRIAGLKLPPTVSVDYGGVSQQMNDTFRQLGLAIAAAVAIVYLLLVITFGGGLIPLTILFSLPFTVIGGLVALYLTGETISASVMMGALMLIGIVVTNAIVLIDRVLHMEKQGMPTRQALLEAASTRLRPILMTALATIGALLPLALGFESAGGVLISKGLGITVIGGLISSTLLTLLIVPIVYETLARFRRKRDGGADSRH